MSEFYTWIILLINQLGDFGEEQLSVFGSRGGQICPLMHVALCTVTPAVKVTTCSTAER